MAIAVVTPTKLAGREEISAVVAGVAIDATDGLEFEHKFADERTFLVLNSSAGGTVVVKAGNGLNALEDNDFSFTVATGIQYLQITSALFKNVSGTNKGKVIVTGPATTKVSVVVLP